MRALETGFWLFSLGLALKLSACTPQKSSDLSRGDRSKSGGSAPSSDSTPDKDGVAPPSSVTGTYLSCAIDRLASDNDPQSQLACALIDASSQKKADLKQIVQNPQFQISPPEGVRVQRLLLNEDPRWHVLFTLRAESAAAANDALKTSQLSFQATGKAGEALAQSSSSGEALNSSKNVTAPAANALYTKVQALALSNVTSNGQTQYACRGLSTQDRGYHLGRVLSDSQGCAFSFATGSERAEIFDYITRPTSENWLSARDGTIPSTALALGYEGNGNPQYLCRANVSAEGIVFGKIAAGYGGCNIFASSGYIQIASYEILVP